MVSKTEFFRLLIIAAIPSALVHCQSIIPLKIGSFHQHMSQNDLGRGFKLNVAPREDGFKNKVFDGTLEIQRMTGSTTVFTVIKDFKSLEKSMEIGGRLAMSYGPTINGEGSSGNYLDKYVSSARQVTLVYRSRHTDFIKRLKPGTLMPTQDAADIISQPQKLANNFGTLFVDTIVYGAQLDVSFTITSTEDIDIEEIEVGIKGGIDNNGALDVEFAAKFEKQDGQERAVYNIYISAEATGVFVSIPVNPTFEQVAKIIEDFNIEYATKFEDFNMEDIPFWGQIEPVAFRLSATADRIDTLDKMEVAVLEEKMEKLGRAFSDTMLWKTKLNVINRDLRIRYESNHKLRVEMYNPYIKQQRMKMKALNEKINECLAFRASSLSVLVASTVPDAYPIVGSADEDVFRGLSGEYYSSDPVEFGSHEPLQDMYYIGFALKAGDEMIPWMHGCLRRKEDDVVIAIAETPEKLFSQVAQSAPLTQAPTLDSLYPISLPGVTSGSPSFMPSEGPSATQRSSISPSAISSGSPSFQPSEQPTMDPSMKQLTTPSVIPSIMPSLQLQHHAVELSMDFDGLIRELSERAQIAYNAVTAERIRQEFRASSLQFQDLFVGARVKKQELFTPTSGEIDGDRIWQEQQQSVLTIFCDTSILFRSENNTAEIELIVGSAFNKKDQRKAYIDELREKTRRNRDFMGVTRLAVEVNENTIVVDNPLPSMPDEDKSSNLVRILGAIVCGIAAVIFLFLFLRRERFPKDDATFTTTKMTPPRSSTRIATNIFVEPQDDISTLGYPMHGAGISTPGLERDETVSPSIVSGDYEYLKNHRAKFAVAGRERTDSLQNSLEASSLDDSAADLTHFGALGTTHGSIFSDDASFERQFTERKDRERQYTEREDRFEVVVPAGKPLGLIIDTPSGEMPIVRSIKDASILTDRVMVGDRLISVDDEDTTGFTAMHVSKLMSQKAHTEFRTLMFSRTRSLV